jgi:hypothetical protein
MVMMVMMVMMILVVVMVMVMVMVMVVLGHLEGPLVRTGIAAIAFLLNLHRVGNWVQQLSEGASGLQRARSIEGRGGCGPGSANESKR